MNIGKRKDTQLCVICQKANGQCPWSHNLAPVKGWDAQLVPFAIGNGVVSFTYQISDCPLFEKDDACDTCIRNGDDTYCRQCAYKAGLKYQVKYKGHNEAVWEE